MGYRRHVLNRGHEYAGALDCADGCFTNAVDFREPVKPTVPALPQEIVLP